MQSLPSPSLHASLIGTETRAFCCANRFPDWQPPQGAPPDTTVQPANFHGSGAIVDKFGRREPDYSYYTGGCLGTVSPSNYLLRMWQALHLRCTRLFDSFAIRTCHCVLYAGR